MAMATATATADPGAQPANSSTATPEPSEKTAASNGDAHPPPPKPQKTATSSSKKNKGPAGGFDDTPVPRAPPGFTVKITFHRATNLPLADINTLSADPFIVAQLSTNLTPRHKEDPPIALRTHTVRQNTDPEWNTTWIVANVPPSGFRLKCRIYDEDPADHDDRLGNVHVDSGPIGENWSGIKEQSYPLKKRMASKRAYLLRALAVCFGRVEHMSGALYVSAELLGRSQDENGGRAYTIGPQYWIRHYSPLLGRLLGQKEPREGGVSKRTGRPKPERYNFQANQMQLRGPVPEEMYHRYVEFKPFVKAMFTAKGVRGYILSKALHHQHARVYNFDQNTAYESFPEPCREMTQKFLELVHHDQGGRIFTYVLTLDGLFRFTETGKEFGIDMLSKHTMHSDVAAYIAFSGEFFIRRYKHHHGSGETHPPHDLDGGPPEDDPPKDPSYYQLIIDNDSGTYRPNAKLLPHLRSFFERNFPGLRVMTLDCQGDAEKMEKMKNEQRELKKKEGDQIVFTQLSRTSSMSSSDIEELDRLEEAGQMDERHLRHQMMREAEARADAVKSHLKEYKPSNNHEGWKASSRERRQKGSQAYTEEEGIENGEASKPKSAEPGIATEKENATETEAGPKGGKETADSR